MGIAYRRSVATSPSTEGSTVAPLLSVLGHAIVIPVFLTATIAVRETPRFEDFNLFGFAGGEVVEAQMAQPTDLVEEEQGLKAASVVEALDLVESVAADSIEEVRAIEEVAADMVLEPAAAPVAPALAEASDIVPEATAAEPSTMAATLEPAVPQETVESPKYGADVLVSVPYPPTEQLALTPASLEPAAERVIAEAVEVIESAAMEQPLELASLVVEEARQVQSEPHRLPARKSLPVDERSSGAEQQAKLPITAADRRLLQSSPDLWQVVAALRQQVARCWAGAVAASGAPEFIDLEVAFDRSGRLKLARVQHAGRLLRERGYSREARHAREALKACSPFALPNEHYGLWRHFTMRFVLSAT